MQTQNQLNNTHRLVRFLYLGSVDNVLICSTRETKVETILESMSKVHEMVMPKRESYPFDIIQRVMQSGMMLRRDEGFMALAYCIRRVDNDKLREHVYSNINELLVTDTDLFMFIKYAMLLLRPPPPTTQPQPPPAEAAASSTTENNAPNDARPREERDAGAHHVGFGRGMRRAISKWYQTKTPEMLADLLGRRRGMYRWTHMDLIKLCHVKFSPETEPEKLQIIKAMYNRGVKVLKKVSDASIVVDPQSGNMTKLCNIFRFKICEDVQDGARMFAQHQFDLDHVPSHFLADPVFWSMALPLVPYDKMLKIMLTLHGYGLFDKHPALFEVVHRRLGNEQEVLNSGLPPLYLMKLVNGYETNRRYSEATKAGWYKKSRVDPHNVQPRPELVKQLNDALETSFDNIPAISNNPVIITLDLRRNDLHRKVFNMEHLNCIEAMSAITLAIVKRNMHRVYVYTYTDMPQMTQIYIDNDDTFLSAYEKFRNVAYHKTSQTLALPVKYAASIHGPVHFVTMFSSVARICRQGLMNGFEELQKYRERHSDSRYAVLNLGRHKHDLHSYQHLGLLEICGLHPNIMQLLAAYLQQKFY